MNNDTTKQSALYSLGDVNCRITIKKCDILSQCGWKVIHCPSTYETDSQIIYKDSLIGKFMRKFEAQKDSILSQIDHFIRKNTTKTLNRESGRYKFPLGTVCPIEIDDDNYCLCAFNEQPKRESLKDLSLSDYISYWENFWVNLQHLKAQDISVAVPGGNKVNVGPEQFVISQKIGVIAYTFFKSQPKPKKLTICLYGDEADEFDYCGWENTILPFLRQMSLLPIRWRIELPSIPGGSEEKERGPIKGLFPPDFIFDLLITDLHQIADNIDNVNGREILQKEGRSRQENIQIEADTSRFRNLIDHLGEKPQMKSHFSTRSKNSYDPNSLFELLGILREKTDVFGVKGQNQLNNQNIIRVCLGYTDVNHNGDFLLSSDDELPEPWRKLGTRISAISRRITPCFDEICKKPFYQDILSFLAQE